MTAEIDYLPIWPTHERLYELAEIARKHPERFDRWVLIYIGLSEGQFKVRHMEHENSKIIECLGVLNAGQKQLWDEAFNR